MRPHSVVDRELSTGAAPTAYVQAPQRNRLDATAPYLVALVASVLGFCPPAIECPAHPLGRRRCTLSRGCLAGRGSRLPRAVRWVPALCVARSHLGRRSRGACSSLRNLYQYRCQPPHGPRRGGGSMFRRPQQSLTNRPMRLWLSLMTVCLPLVGIEVVANLANVHWFFLWGTFWRSIPTVDHHSNTLDRCVHPGRDMERDSDGGVAASRLVYVVAQARCWPVRAGGGLPDRHRIRAACDVPSSPGFERALPGHAHSDQVDGSRGSFAVDHERRDDTSDAA